MESKLNSSNEFHGYIIQGSECNSWKNHGKVQYFMECHLSSAGTKVPQFPR